MFVVNDALVCRKIDYTIFWFPPRNSWISLQSNLLNFPGAKIYEIVQHTVQVNKRPLFKVCKLICTVFGWVHILNNISFKKHERVLNLRGRLPHFIVFFIVLESLKLFKTMTLAWMGIFCCFSCFFDIKMIE